MRPLRSGRFSLLFGFIGITAFVLTFFAPAVLVLLGTFVVATLGLGLVGFRSRAGRVGVAVALGVLPCLTLLTCHYGFEVQARRASPPSTVEVYFSPKGGCTEAIVSQINQAKRSVMVQAYSFTSRPIAHALVNAHRRGVEVCVVLDKSHDNASYSVATYLNNNGITPLIDRQHEIAHNKLMIMDSDVVVTGSMNFSEAGESRNAENILVLHDTALAATYTDNWHLHANHSSPYQLVPALPSSADSDDQE